MLTGRLDEDADWMKFCMIFALRYVLNNRMVIPSPSPCDNRVLPPFFFSGKFVVINPSKHIDTTF